MAISESTSMPNGIKNTSSSKGQNGVEPHVTEEHATTWSPSSWRSKPIKQDVVYQDRGAVDAALAKLARLPPLVTPTEICKLKASLRDVALGKAFLLQGGDCAELFDYCEENAIDSKIKLLLQMSLVLIWGANKPVVRIARMAGQFAKPRSSPTEVVNGKEIPSFRGDNINGFDASERTPDPSRLVSAYFHSAATLNYIRAQLSSGIADLHSPLNWNLGHVKSASIKAKYQRIVTSITESLRFMKTIGADTAGQLQTVDLYTSHEGLLLEYEQSLTRKLKHPPTYSPLPSSSPSPSEGYYNTSAHFLWIGDRTRQPTGAHVEYFRGLANPIGIKVGPSTTSSDLTALLDIVNPAHEIGKVTLITRYGETQVAEKLGAHIDAVRASGHTVIWQCDPMHGNTITVPTQTQAAGGLKTRRFSSIYAELVATLRIHHEHGSFLGGVHLELTGDPVTECMGGSENLTDEDLPLNYTTFCDPRLNEKQALELAFLIAEDLRGREGVENGV
ncbi:MAG: Aromatic/aminoadipate aminotransferase 1 [Peltula sp. TS41687]|nr:MAG: Aromatic/aminoadipate aminotransferase 1 [Peltula sp. TS41687]